MNDGILITGCARSGTSMTAGIINLCGAFGGKLLGPSPFNRKGMFENLEIRQNICKPFLRSIGADPLGQNPLPDINKVKEVATKEFCAGWKDKIVLKLISHGYKDGAWFYKGAKMCLMWPVWSRAFPKATWIIVRRNKEEIINSCLRTAFMNKYRTAEGWGKWVDEHERRFQEMKEAGLIIYETHPSEMINGNFSEIEFIVRKSGLTWNENKVKEFIDFKLWNKDNTP